MTTLHERSCALEAAVLRQENAARRRHPKSAIRAAESPPPDDAARIPADILTIGLVGGTGVGKSTLVNALARREISKTSSRRPTTEAIIPWIHRDRVDLLESLPAIAKHLTADVRPHDIERLRSVVVFDLPDIDSVSTSHAATVAEALGALDVVVLVTSITKYHDRVFHDWLRQALPQIDLDNCLFVLNKVDEIDPAEGPDGVTKLHQRFADVVVRTLRDAGCVRGRPRFYAISALRGVDATHGNAFTRLEDDLFVERTERERQRIKSSNRITRLGRRLAALEGELRLEPRKIWLASEIEFIEKSAGECAGNDAVRAEIEALVQSTPAYREIAARLFSNNVRHWPLLSKLDFLLSPFRQMERLVQVLSTLAGRGSDPAPETTAQLTSVRGAIEDIQRERRRRRSLVVEDDFEPDDSLRSKKTIDNWMTRIQSALDQEVRASYADVPPASTQTDHRSRWRAIVVWFPAFWFPIVQPLLQEALDPGSSLASLPLRLLHRLVRIVGAPHLLTSTLFVAIVWTVILLVLRGSARRAASRHCRSLVTSKHLETFLGGHIVALVAEPLRQQIAALGEENAALQRVRADLEALAHDVAGAS